MPRARRSRLWLLSIELELELELIQSHMTQKPALRGEVNSFQELGRARGRQRDLANFLWVAYFNELFQAADNRNRIHLAQGATAGSGLVLQGIPSVSHFHFPPRVMRAQVKALV